MWGRQKTLPPTAPAANLKPISYPSGVAVQVEDEFYYVKGKSLYRFVSERAYLSWSIPVAQARAANISEYAVNGILGFRDGTLIQGVSDGKMYLVSESKKRLVTDPDILVMLGLSRGDAVTVSDKEVNSHQNGDDI